MYNCLSPGAKGSQLGAHHSGSLDPGVSQRIQDSLSSGTLSMAITIHLHNISGEKRKWQRAVQAGDQSQSSQQVCGIDTFQDGKSPDCQESPTARGLHDEARLERCLLHNPSPPQTPTLPPVHFSRQVVQVPLPSIRALVSPTSAHKNVEASGSSPSFSRGSCGVLFGRHSTPTPEQRLSS